MFLACVLGSACAQENNSQSGPTGQHPDRPAAPAVEDSATENLPLSAVDQPSLTPDTTGRSFFSIGLQVGQGVDSNAAGQPGASSLQSVTQGLGSLTLQKEWRRQAFNLAYVGGGSFSSNAGVGASQEHELSAVERMSWRSGQLAFRDLFSYLPEGSFGQGAFGGGGSLLGLTGVDPGFGGSFGGTSTSVLSSGQFGSLGKQPRITNVAMMDLIQEFTSRSSFTMAGSYGLTHFMDDAANSINSRQLSAQAGYNHRLTRADQIGIVYGFQEFRYPAPIGTKVISHIANVIYGHRLSERMDLSVGGGPQATEVADPQGRTKWTVSGVGQATLRYQFPQASLTLEYRRNNTSGSGVVAGAITDVVTVTAARPVGRKWSATLDIGYARNSSISPPSTSSNGQQYTYWYAASGVRRQIGRHMGITASYQYNQQLLDRSFCGTSSPCNGSTGRNSAFIGLDWRPGPVRLD